ncbi:hypothetical protein [Endozoicomonas sp. Mp262]|uniref:hypothetical protein n=1 Tax=Endozoicomonas sp. Mp262 TaxID=2919499 RepID=UPI0021D85288
MYPSLIKAFALIVLLYTTSSVAALTYTLRYYSYSEGSFGCPSIVKWTIYPVADHYKLIVSYPGKKRNICFELSSFSYSVNEKGEYKIEYSELTKRDDLVLEHPDEILSIIENESSQDY